MAFQLEKHAGEVLGPYSKGLVSIGLAESLFEKGGNIYKVLELANRGLMETMNGGKFELQFAGAALVARVYLVTGHPGDSVKTLEEIETRAQQRGARRVVRNVRAMQSRIKLWQGRVEDAVRWMENEPQNEIHFNVLERYCYNTFVRVYMAQQRYDKTAQTSCGCAAMPIWKSGPGSRWRATCWNPSSVTAPGTRCGKRS